MARWVDVYLRFDKEPEPERLDALNAQLRRADHEAIQLHYLGSDTKYVWRAPLISKDEFKRLLEAYEFKCTLLWLEQGSYPEYFSNPLRHCAAEVVEVTHGNDHPRLQHIIDLLGKCTDDELDAVAEALIGESEIRDERKQTVARMRKECNLPPLKEHKAE